MTKDHRSTSPAASQPATSEDAGSPPPPAPGAGTLSLLAVVWLLAMLSSAQQAVGGSPGTAPFAVIRAAHELPQVVLASLIAGLAVGLFAGNLLWRFVPAAAAHRWLPRLAVAGAAGALTGLAIAAPILLNYDGLPSILVLSTAVAAAAAMGGLLAGAGRPTVVAAGVAGALAMFLVGLVERLFESDLRRLFGAGDTTASVVTAVGWVTLIASLVAGVAAAGLGYAYLRRCGPEGARWPAFLLAGAMPGLLMLLAEAVTRLGGARLFQLVSALSEGDQTVLGYFHEARFNRALIVLFVGAITAILLLGRTIRPEPEPEGPEPGPEPVPETEPDPASKLEPEPEPESTSELNR